MTFDPRWDAVHCERQWATNPCEHLCRFVATNYPDGGINDHRRLRVLDLGCGAGAQSFFLETRGFAVTGIDGSFEAINRCLRGGLANRAIDTVFKVSDITAIPFSHNEFALVVDVASLQCLDYADAVNAMAEVHRVLKPGGRFFSYTSRVGTSLAVHRNMPVRSMARQEVYALYGKHFDVRTVDTDTHTRDNGALVVSHWIIVARKAA